MPADPQFIACLFEPDDLVEVRTLPGKQQQYVRASDLRELDPQLQEASEAGQNIFVGVNPRRRRGGKAADVALARCVFVDHDGIDLEEARRRNEAAGLPEPTLEVASGHGIHVYWQLTAPLADLRVWTMAQKTLIRRLQSDPAVCDPPRIMRVPGFVNHKPPARMAEVIEARPGQNYPLKVFAEIAPKEEIPVTQHTQTMALVGCVGWAGCVTITPGQVIDLTLPRRPKQRNAAILRLARGLKFDAGMKDRPLAEVKPFVRMWHRRALDTIDTKPFTDSWADFIRAWGRASQPLAGGPVGESLAEARRQAAEGRLPPPAMEYDSEPVRLLVGLCANLARRGEGEFYLSCHDAGGRLGTSAMWVHRMIGMLVADGVLAVVSPGDRSRATEYRWLAKDH